MRTLESQENTDTALAEIAYLSARNPAQVFHSLMHHINEGVCDAASTSWMERRL